MIKRSIIGTFIILSLSSALIASSYTIPFRLVNNLIVFQGTVERQVGNFILDTGTSEIILNRAYFEGKANLIGGGSFQSIHGQTQSDRGDHIQLHLDELSIRSYAAIIDLRPIEKQKRMNILGMVGLRALKRYEIMIDYFSQQIILHKIDKKGNRLVQKPLPIPSETLPFRYKEHILYISAWIDNLQLKLGLDTGVEVNVFSPKVLDRIKDKMNDIKSRNVIGMNGKTSLTSSAQVENLQVGKLMLPAMETVFMSMEPLNQLSGPNLDGLLGQEFLKHYQAAFNFKKKEIYLWDEQAAKQGPVAAGTN